jgi:hypothetical protein
MYNVPPPAPLSSVSTTPANVHNCTIVDASSLLYQPALRAAVVQEQVALLTARLAMARWTSGNAAPFPPAGHEAQPFRAAFYARAQQAFFAWIERGGMWEADGGDVLASERIVCDLKGDAAVD